MVPGARASAHLQLDELDSVSLAPVWYTKPDFTVNLLFTHLPAFAQVVLPLPIAFTLSSKPVITIVSPHTTTGGTWVVILLSDTLPCSTSVAPGPPGTFGASRNRI